MTRARGATWLLAALLVAPLARPGEPTVAPLPDAVQHLADEGRPLDAWHALVDGLQAALPTLHRPRRARRPRPRSRACSCST